MDKSRPAFWRYTSLSQFADSVVQRKRDRVCIEGLILEECSIEALRDRWTINIIHIPKLYQYGINNSSTDRLTT
jgi:hypothetical protein